MSNTKEALVWITGILKQHQIPFQISGGLAAIAYGASRPLADIDIDIPDSKFDLLIDEVKPYITYGPERFKSDKWDLMLMTLNYRDQEIDLSGADSTYIFNEQMQQWIKLDEDFSKVNLKTIFDLSLPVIPIKNLINYKKILSREVDLIDLKQIENRSMLT